MTDFELNRSEIDSEARVMHALARSQLGSTNGSAERTEALGNRELEGLAVQKDGKGKKARRTKEKFASFCSRAESLFSRNRNRECTN